MKMNRLASLASIAVMSAAIIGCANHVEMKTVTETHIDRTPVAKSIDIDVMPTAQPGAWTITAFSHSIDDVVTRENTNTYDVSTPYQAGRELYELPLGIISLAGGVVVNVIDIALLGMIPNNVTNAPLNVGFAGINPFMNIESKDRTVSALIESSERVLDTRTDRSSTPLDALTAEAEATSTLIALNANGEADFSLAELDGLDLSHLNHVKFIAADGEYTETKLVRVSMRDAVRIENAVALLSKYKTVSPDLETREAASDIYILTRMGFDNLATKLETNLKNSLSREQYNEVKALARNMYLSDNS